MDWKEKGKQAEIRFNELRNQEEVLGRQLEQVKQEQFRLQGEFRLIQEAMKEKEKQEKVADGILASSDEKKNDEEKVVDIKSKKKEK